MATATATATPPNSLACPVIAGIPPPVLVLVEDFDELLPVCEELLPIFAVALEVLLALALVVSDPDVFEAVGIAVVLEGAADPSLDPVSSVPAVIVTG